MKILFTGASSFTGYWFVKELAAAGHEVVAVFRRSEYADEPRRTRVALLNQLCRPVHDVAFGDNSFIDLINEGGWDVFCHHGAESSNYKSPDFDVPAALAANTFRHTSVIRSLQSAGCGSIVLTGSVFENDEGAGSTELHAFSPYGVSKGLTWQTFRYSAHAAGMPLRKFVIPNPFGPFEEPRFTHYLMNNWLAGRKPSVNTPAYVRDNIHVALLAKAYSGFATGPLAGTKRLGPSGYIETQGAFTARFAEEMRTRLAIPCEFELKTQTAFPEPRIRINTDILDTAALRFDEAGAWDAIAEYYLALVRRPTLTDA
ncbi:MAG: NAD(P)-dependent oxidoreductase [Bradyrhizobium sp.]|nr:NAD(P)-dependent oxidoreductase [Bradyrhizobium sp.]